MTFLSLKYSILADSEINGCICAPFSFPLVKEQLMLHIGTLILKGRIALSELHLIRFLSVSLRINTEWIEVGQVAATANFLSSVESFCW